MARDFSRFRREIAGIFAGDLAPVGAQVINVPATGVGNLFRMQLRRPDDVVRRTRTFQGYYRVTNFAGTLTLVAWVAAGDGTGAGDWIQVGAGLAAVPILTLFEGTLTEDADLVLQVTPAPAMIAGDVVEIFLEEVA